MTAVGDRVCETLLNDANFRENRRISSGHFLKRAKGKKAHIGIAAHDIVEDMFVDIALRAISDEGLL